MTMMMYKYIMAILALLLLTGVVAADSVVISDVQLLEGESADIPIMILGATDVAAAQADITYDPAVIEITNILDGDMSWTMSNLAVDNDTVRVVILSLSDGLAGDFTMATLQVTAVGVAGDVSPLVMSDTTLGDSDAIDIPITITDGSVTIVSDNMPPVIVSVTRDTVYPGEVTHVGVRATDDGAITNVSYDLTEFGLGVVDANQILGDDYDLEFTMPLAMSPGSYEVSVSVEDDDGAITVATVDIVVQLRGDVNEDGVVTSQDALLVCTEIATPGSTSINMVVADANEDGVLNVLDARLILNIAAGVTLG